MGLKVVVALGMAIVFAFCVVLAQEPDKEEAALSSAESWLFLVDGGKYSDSWNETAGYFRGAMKEDR